MGAARAVLGWLSASPSLDDVELAGARRGVRYRPLFESARRDPQHLKNYLTLVGSRGIFRDRDLDAVIDAHDDHTVARVISSIDPTSRQDIFRRIAVRNVVQSIARDWEGAKGPTAWEQRHPAIAKMIAGEANARN